MWPHLIRFVRLLVFTACLVVPAAALAGETAWEYWPEIDIWAKTPWQIRFSSFIAGSKNVETEYREGNIILQADYAWKRHGSRLKWRLAEEGEAGELRSLMVRGGFLGGRSLDDDGAQYTEKTGLLEFHVRVPMKGGILVSHRIRTDLRFLGEAEDFSWRFRYRLMTEKDVTALGTSLVPYASAEAYYDSRVSAINRIRAIGGVTVSLISQLAVEANLTYQFDPRSSASNLAALNTILHVYF